MTAAFDLDELALLSARRRTEAAELAARIGGRPPPPPDLRDARIDRCPRCGAWRWDGACRVRHPG